MPRGQVAMEFDGNLVWIDLEMTGLEPSTDVILEIASVITDGNLAVLKEGPHHIIYQPEERLASMNEWSKEQHTKTGLVEEVRRSDVSLKQAEEQMLAFIKSHCKPETGLLAGNSVWQDRNFMVRYMPSIPAYLHYRLIDVTTIKELVARWYPENEHAEYVKKDVHRAREDVYESIAELKHYKKYFFV